MGPYLRLSSAPCADDQRPPQLQFARHQRSRRGSPRIGSGSTFNRVIIPSRKADRVRVTRRNRCSSRPSGQADPRRRRAKAGWPALPRGATRAAPKRGERQTQRRHSRLCCRVDFRRKTEMTSCYLVSRYSTCSRARIFLSKALCSSRRSWIARTLARSSAARCSMLVASRTSIATVSSIGALGLFVPIVSVGRQLGKARCHQQRGRTQPRARKSSLLSQMLGDQSPLVPSFDRHYPAASSPKPLL